MDPPDNFYQTSYDSKTKIVVFYSLINLSLFLTISVKLQDILVLIPQTYHWETHVFVVVQNIS